MTANEHSTESALRQWKEGMEKGDRACAFKYCAHFVDCNKADDRIVEILEGLVRDEEDPCADACALLESFAARGGRFVVHCFAGTCDWAERFLALGGYCGVTGMVTFRKAENIREALRVIPDDKLLLETDSPYLAPVPHRGSENLPGFMPLIAAAAAAVRGVTAPELAKVTTANARRFFRISEVEHE